jgi:cyclic pyranopterin phosphate synthase
VKVYAFEEIDESFKLLPLAARRALDGARAKISLSTWQQLPHGVKSEFVQLGSARVLNVGAVLHLLERSGAEPEPIEAAEPSEHQVPESVLSMLTRGQLLGVGTWSALTPLDRYALTKVASRGRSERFARAYAEIVGSSGLSSHLGKTGDVRMVDVSTKEPTLRRALAESAVSMNEEAFAALEGRHAEKGDVLATARIAGIMAAKKTADLIPLCHPLSLSHCEVQLELWPSERRVVVTARVEVIARTGVEMEAMLAATTAALTIYDMLKGVDRAMLVGPTRLLEKSGGKSGDFRR